MSLLPKSRSAHSGEISSFCSSKRIDYCRFSGVIVAILSFLSALRNNRSRGRSSTGQAIIPFVLLCRME